MSSRLTPDLCIIGAGSAGLSIAAGAQQMGSDCVLIERDRMGGDCLNSGCVPSKALLSAAKAAAFYTKTEKLGVSYAKPQVGFKQVHDHVHGVIAEIAPHDSVERFEGLGVTVIKAAARFTGPKTLEAGGQTIAARRFVIASGSRPLVPPIPGLDQVPYLTNESLFDLENLPKKLLVIGGGPIGCEMAQAFRRLGSEVALFEMGRILPKDDPELAEVVQKSLLAEGLELYENSRVLSLSKGSANQGIELEFERDGKRQKVTGSHVLLAAGRQANVEDLNLEAAGIAYDRRGIKTDKGLRTSNRRVYAAGDVAAPEGGGFQFTHVAGAHAGVIIKSALFRLPAKAEKAAVPWVTYSDPELAHVGLSEEVARQEGQAVNILRWSFEENDRAKAEGDCKGMIKVVTTPKGKILGASIVGSNAGELITPWTLSIAQGLKIGAMAQVIVPYPTRSEISKRAAGSFYSQSLFSERTKKIVRFLQGFG